jgi:hypothetical protein
MGRGDSTISEDLTSQIGDVFNTLASMNPENVLTQFAMYVVEKNVFIPLP